MSVEADQRRVKLIYANVTDYVKHIAHPVNLVSTSGLNVMKLRNLKPNVINQYGYLSFIKNSI